jgi:hypothetical protein
MTESMLFAEEEHPLNAAAPTTAEEKTTWGSTSARRCFEFEEFYPREDVKLKQSVLESSKAKLLWPKIVTTKESRRLDISIADADVTNSHPHLLAPA